MLHDAWFYGFVLVLDGLVGIQLSMRDFDVEVWCDGMVFGSGREHNLFILLARYKICERAWKPKCAHRKRIYS